MKSKNEAYNKLIEPHLFDYSRILRENELPIEGIEEVLKYYTNENLSFELMPKAGKISRANDFGFTYGLAKCNINDEIKEYTYFHVWARQDDMWKLLLDLKTPLNSN